MVYVHGGGGTIGSGKMYSNSSSLVHHGVILVVRNLPLWTGPLSPCAWTHSVALDYQLSSWNSWLSGTRTSVDGTRGHLRELPGD